MSITLSASDPCPCTSSRSFGECCRPYLVEGRPAPTAEALMRSRYTAYALNQIDYIADTDHPSRRSEFDRKSATAWATQSTWHGLDILDRVGGGSEDTQGTVEFNAKFSVGGKAREHRERSTFSRIEGRWYYVDGKTPAEKPFVNASALPGRNDPCSCGSGKKFKKCHGQ